MQANAARRILSALAAEGASEAGLTLIEVVISAMLVAIIAIATLTGFDAAGKATANERQHNQATLLAAQDEERLHGLNVTELGRLGSETLPTVTEGGTNFTVESEARFVSAAKEEETCATSGGNADYIRTTSTVTWPSLTKKKTVAEPEPLEKVAQSSIVPVPTSTSLLVKVHDQANEPVEGATVKVTGATTKSTVEQTTPESGCVIFGALADGKVKITATKAGWINEAGESEPAATEATLSTTGLVTATFTIAQPGSILAEFESAGTPVQGDTFYAAHTGFEGETVGGTASTYGSTARLEGLFPFQTAGTPPGSSPYTSYAGECAENAAEQVAKPNNIVSGKKEVTNRTVQVNPGATTAVKVEVPPVKVELYEGTSSTTKGALDGKAEAKVTYCGASHVMKTTTAGALEHPNLPYGEKLELCLTQLVGTQRYKYVTKVVNTARAGVTVPTIYMTATANKSTTGC